MNKDSGYVLKNSDGLYFIGMNNADTQLRKAQIYHSEKYALQSMEDINTNSNRIKWAKHDFALVRVEIAEVESEVGE